MDLLFSFAGRIGRGQFWLGYLATIVLAALIVIIVSIIVPWEQVVVTDADGQQTIDYTNPATLPAWIGYLFYFVIGMWITIAISIKRFHDRGKSAGWSLIMFIPLIGSIWLLIELGFLRGDPGPNAYGPPRFPLGGPFQATVKSLSVERPIDAGKGAYRGVTCEPSPDGLGTRG